MMMSSTVFRVGQSYNLHVNPTRAVIREKKLWTEEYLSAIDRAQAEKGIFLYKYGKYTS